MIAVTIENRRLLRQIVQAFFKFKSLIRDQTQLELFYNQLDLITVHTLGLRLFEVFPNDLDSDLWT